jgi:hypothetical protein
VCAMMDSAWLQVTKVPRLYLSPQGHLPVKGRLLVGLCQVLTVGCGAGQNFPVPHSDMQ